MEGNSHIYIAGDTYHRLAWEASICGWERLVVLPEHMLPRASEQPARLGAFSESIENSTFGVFESG